MKTDINTKKFPFPDDKRLKQVKFIVTDGDTFRFWQQYHNIATLKQDSMGCTFQYADFGKSKPCWASLWFYHVNGVYTAFVDAHGAYVDYHKLETYVFAMCGMTPTPDNQCNGDNTHNHVAIREIPRLRYLTGLEADLLELAQEIASLKR
jgi:hypothetical protein